MLGVGPKRSQYFSHLFRSQLQLREAKTSCTLIANLEPSAAKAFPIVLDFMYSQTDEFTDTVENAVALRFLSRYFGIENLFHRVTAIIQTLLTTYANSSTLLLILMEASAHHDDKVFNLACKQCAEHFCHLANDDINSLPQICSIKYFRHHTCGNK